MFGFSPLALSVPLTKPCEGAYIEHLVFWQGPVPIPPIPKRRSGYPRRPVYLKSKTQRRSVRRSYPKKTHAQPQSD